METQQLVEETHEPIHIPQSILNRARGRPVKYNKYDKGQRRPLGRPKGTARMAGTMRKSIIGKSTVPIMTKSHIVLLELRLTNLRLKKVNKYGGTIVGQAVGNNKVKYMIIAIET